MKPPRDIWLILRWNRASENFRPNTSSSCPRTWAEYRALFESGVPYALDLSHLNILATWSGRRETALVAEMLACERCLEIHVSDNDGHGDGHLVCEAPPWWFDLLDGCHGGAVIFAEGNHRFPAGKHSAVI
ncbi:MAG: hypothetical protein LBP86_11370 [Azoarcus sp.]|nr:hypothetical protein [Azoarcus sp.]